MVRPGKHEVGSACPPSSGVGGRSAALTSVTSDEDENSAACKAVRQDLENIAINAKPSPTSCKNGESEQKASGMFVLNQIFHQKKRNFLFLFHRTFKKTLLPTTTYTKEW